MVQRKWAGVSWLAVFAIAMHTIFVGLAPLASAAPVDPFSVICHSQPAGTSQDGQDSLPGGPPSSPCDHCKLCNAVAAPVAPEALLDWDLAPTGLIEVLYPTSMAPVNGIDRTPKLARGPPQRA